MPEFIDVSAPDYLEIVINDTGTIVWINDAERCLFRACQITKLHLDDRRVAASGEADAVSG
jgi:hypothetical protein